MKISATTAEMLERYSTHFLYYDPARGSWWWADRVDGEDSYRANQRQAEFVATHKLVEVGYMRTITPLGLQAIWEYRKSNGRRAKVGA
jgi:hypothetical protein